MAAGEGAEVGCLAHGDGKARAEQATKNLSRFAGEVDGAKHRG
jgi:hypothetical protein